MSPTDFELAIMFEMANGVYSPRPVQPLPTKNPPKIKATQINISTSKPR